jgi:hypothetical protein
MCRLLRYLIESSLSNSGRQMSEYAIALDVFDRNPSTYYPGEDPVVRVQMGRLRKRLVSYYAVSPKDSPVIVSIPLGHYEPVIERRVQESIIGAFSLALHFGRFPWTHLDQGCECTT